MVAEFGHFGLILAFVVAIMQAVLPMIGAEKNNMALMQLGQTSAIAHFLALLVAFAALTYGYLASDFSLVNIYTNSHSLKPILYKISGVWGNHEGSLLLWVTILALFSVLVAFAGRDIAPRLKARTLSVQAMISVGFLAFILFTSNPFERLFPPPIEGQDLNPLLQDPGLAFHPPMLYVGYVGLSLTFSFAVAALIEGKVDAAWAGWVRPWTLLAWIFLTAGIALGSWWAYYELGWGGFWYWDPVENAAFMPWLAATALLHSAIVAEKRDALKRWTILLAIMAFSFSLLGTFLVRSGVLTSVHAFATDPDRGILILLILAIAIGGSLSLFAYRGMAVESDLSPGSLFHPISREGALLLNNLLLSTALVTVFIGTLYPLFLEVFTTEKVSVGPPFYHATFVPLMVPLLIALGIGPFLSWKRADLLGILIRLRLGFIVMVVITLVTGVVFWGQASYATLGLMLACWLASSVILQFWRRIQLFPSGSLWQRLQRISGAFWGMSFAHFGLALVVAGAVGASLLTKEVIVVMTPGDRQELAGFTIQFDGVKPAIGSNYRGVAGQFSLFQDGKEIGKLTPETRQYFTREMQTTEAAIMTTSWYDLYIVIRDPVRDGPRENMHQQDRPQGGGYTVNAYFKPLVPWLWWGTMMMVVGGILSLADRRLRIGAPRRATPQP